MVWFPTPGVSSVAGKSGAVVLEAADILKRSAGSNGTVVGRANTAIDAPFAEVGLHNAVGTVGAVPFTVPLRDASGRFGWQPPAFTTAARPPRGNVQDGYIYYDLTMNMLVAAVQGSQWGALAMI